MAGEPELRRWTERIRGWQAQKGTEPATDIRYTYFETRCGEALLCRRSETVFLELEELEALLWAQGEHVLSYYRGLFREEVFREMPEALPEEAQLALKLQEIREYRRQGDDLHVIEGIRRSLSLYPALEKAMQLYGELYRERLAAEKEKREKEQAELDGLVRSLKGIAREQLKSGQQEAAREILLQILQCRPGDQEAEELLRRCAGEPEA
ncbi:MAG: hypothetical protein NC432_15735 [Roseburia sp.]|nr:hypothetical protein [Roseburia sp.]MCM1099730.1 hypothetical protein [Ruminococcus flavefaciens]